MDGQGQVRDGRSSLGISMVLGATGGLSVSVFVGPEKSPVLRASEGRSTFTPWSTHSLARKPPVPPRSDGCTREANVTNPGVTSLSRTSSQSPFTRLGCSFQDTRGQGCCQSQRGRPSRVAQADP